ncbi:MAG: secretin N-terminal domain-containing protein [Syntrophorhabdaceae bacterium]|nr:secretin N-terminal domain-containing protein [Syntrophorhabdaceae bacterium]
MKYLNAPIIILFILFNSVIQSPVFGQQQSPPGTQPPDPILQPAPQSQTGPPDPIIQGRQPQTGPDPILQAAPQQPEKIEPPASQPSPTQAQPTAGKPAPAIKTAPPEQSQTPAMRRPRASAGMISLNFDDADVFSVIQTVFGDILRVNYVVDPKVKGRVTFRSVAPVSRDQVLPVMEVILRINGIGVVEESGLYRVVPLSDISREPSPVSFGRDADKIPTTGKSLIQVVPIIYLQSTEIVKLITPFVSANAVILDVPKSNQIIIVDTDASVRRILRLIETFDNETQKRKRAQVFVYPVQNGKAKDIAALLQQIFLGAKTGTGTGTTSSPGTTTKSGRQATPQVAQVLPQPVQSGGAATGEMLVSDITRIFADEIINSIIILSTPEDYQTIKETIANIDIIPRQVVIEGIIAQVNLTDNMSLGLAYRFKTQISFGKSGISGDIGINADTLANYGSTDPTLKPSGTGFNYVGFDERNQIRAYINALVNDSKGKLLAAPHILVSDNREARIQVGQQVPIVTSETFGSTTVAPQRTIEYKDIGIILKVKPQINDSGLIALELSQEVSTFDTIQLTASEKQIIVNKTEAATSLAVQDGQTIIIGGLIREDTTNSQVGVPFLSKIPILGYLFGNTSRESRRQELIILLTPHVLKDQKEAKNITNEYIDNITDVATTKGGIKKNELLKSGVQIRKGAGKAPDVVIPYRDIPSGGQVPPPQQPVNPDKAPLPGKVNP